MFRYKVMYTTADGRRKTSDCARSFTIANGIARRCLTDGATDVVIQVTKEQDSNA